ncbi:HNH endonuclease signature motif containing protein [Clostridium tarantellae]|uniref:HNH endonuclease signature motif containing protein n=1 Tax=Clostridium tarantellae TaxID=39493 RepID=UPI001F4505AB|nr:HNH endonuclease signature motif containing protein [Clostridium tarantellae]
MGYVAQSRLSEKRRIKAEETIKHKIRNLQKCQHIKYVTDFNSTILGIHEYYKVATYVSLDFKIIARNVNRFIFNRLKKISKYKVPNEEEKDSAFKQFYGESKSYSWVICGRAIYPVHFIKHTSSMNFNQNINDYSKDGREKSTKSLKKNTKLIILQLSERYNPYETVEYNDNRVSRASMTGMKCEVTKIPLEIDEMHCHHQIPRKYGGTDKYDNLRILHKDVHILVHATDEEIIKKYIHILAKSQNTIKRVLNNLNKLRKEAKTKIIKEDDVRMWLEVKTWKTSKAKVI